MKRTIVGTLNTICAAVDELAYRPAVVKLTTPLPMSWCCQLGRLAARLDHRWNTGLWGEWAGPVSRCDVCRRRGAWKEVGLDPRDESWEPTDARVISICDWCQLPQRRILTDEDLDVAIEEATRESIAWRWKRPVAHE